MKLCKLFSIYFDKGTGKQYHICSELIDSNESAYLCNNYSITLSRGVSYFRIKDTTALEILLK